MATPRKGQRVRGSRTGRPIMVLLDALGRRWALRVLWELRGAALTFRALQAACGGVSPSVLAARLRELTELRLVELGDDGYRLTDEGRSLEAVLRPLDAWATRWAR
ncbi:MAG: helix-turn-helix transcriptional regulator [Kofleriaceae bacterium]|nr:helix-turn-helix transcriptional regulator [Myxococcales bacterium]MCB9560078.1 helix-turn-helix transcriptional regulator [Kofleriaceae bacterium]MCB9571869.1 helix-turn-helix transcriptional regulator [Kofleriaceae bacterium]